MCQSDCSLVQKRGMMEFVIQVNVQSVCGVICFVCGLFAFLRTVTYMNRNGQWDFFSPFLGFVALMIGMLEVGTGAFLTFLPTNPLMTVFAVFLSVAAIAHSLIGYRIMKDGE